MQLNSGLYVVRRLPEAVHMGYPPQRELMKPISNRLHYVKPSGGLWLSPRCTEYGWRDWVLDNMPEWNAEEHVLPAAPARLLLIDNMEDLKLALALYPGTSTILPTLNFEAVAAEFDGIWLTHKGQWATRITEPTQPHLYGWDCESILLFRWVWESLNKENNQ